MKKYLAILVTVILIVSLCALCACDNGDELTLYVPDGAPALSVAKIINDKSVGKQPVKAVVTTGEDVVAKCGSGEAEMAVLPTNAAVKICNQRNDYCLFSVNVYGVLYIVGTERIDSISDLQGKTLHSIGLGNTPEYVFKTICDVQNVKYTGENAIDIQYKADASAINPLILNGSAKFALIGEPAVTQLITNAQKKNIEVNTLFDLQELWQRATGSEVKGYPQASMIVKKDLLTDKFAKELTTALSENADYISANCNALNALLKGVGSALDINYTAELLGRCNLTFIAAHSAKADIEKYLSTFPAMANLLPLSDDIIYEASN